MVDAERRETVAKLLAFYHFSLPIKRLDFISRNL